MKKIVQLILALVIVALVYVIYDQISTPIRFEKEKAVKEAVVIDRIKDIRTAQRAFKSKYQHFTADLDIFSSDIPEVIQRRLAYRRPRKFDRIHFCKRRKFARSADLPSHFPHRRDRFFRFKLECDRPARKFIRKS